VGVLFASVKEQFTGLKSRTLLPRRPGTSLACSFGVSCPRRDTDFESEGGVMFYWAAVFLIIALVAGVLGFGGIAGVSSNIAWILFVVGLIIAVVLFLRGRAP
jgi:uncharacterized membrane protein YtjA (UPF0391 family)